MFEIINWPEELKPSRSPLHFTNELEIKASPETLWSMVTDTSLWPQFYPGVREVTQSDGENILRLGSEFETTMLEQHIRCTVQEFEPMTRIGWGGGPVGEDCRAYHAWIFTPTANGTHIWMEETMQGPYLIDLAKQAPDMVWQMHGELLVNIERVAASIESAAARS
jgi:uncharacterized protein YndB with AHSA1/START domain